MNSSNINILCEPYLKPLNISLSIVSFASSLMMTIYCIKNLRHGQRETQLVLGIAFSDLVYSFSNILSIINGTNTGTLCKVEGLIRQWFFNFSLLFVVAIAIFCSKYSQRQNPNQLKYVKKVILIGSAICLLLTIPVFALQDHVSAVNKGLFCLISYNETSIPEKLLVRTIYEGLRDIIYLIISVYCSFKIITTINNLMALQIVRKLQLFGYTFVLCLIVLPALFDNYFRIFNPGCEYHGLIALRVSLTHSAGTLNAIVYGIQQRVRINENNLLEF